MPTHMYVPSEEGSLHASFADDQWSHDLLTIPEQISVGVAMQRLASEAPGSGFEPRVKEEDEEEYEDGEEEEDPIDSMFASIASSPRLLLGRAPQFAVASSPRPHAHSAPKPMDVLGVNLVRGFRSTLQPLPFSLCPQATFEPVTPRPSSGFERVSVPPSAVLLTPVGVAVSLQASPSAAGFQAPLDPDVGGHPRCMSSPPRRVPSRHDVPSRFCHLCNRKTDRERVVCSNIERGTCRKSVCEPCFAEHPEWSWEAAKAPLSAWTCPHCLSLCSTLRGAKCAVYKRTNARRRLAKSVVKQQARHANGQQLVRLKPHPALLLRK
jgi:Zinc-finger domain of monoamine-oxidase A repressor R1